MDRNRAARRMFDLFFASTGLLIASPFMAVTALCIAIGSPGPVIYRARRSGRDGRPFVMYKFRTMRTDASKGSKVTVPGDQRITFVAGLLRKAKFDELPQLLNILRGDMSVVGPRPEDPELVDLFYGPDEWNSLRVRPGLTSPGTLWYFTEGESQLSAGDAMEHYPSVMGRKLRLDVEYFDNATLASDLGVVMQTLAAVLKSFLGGSKIQKGA